MSNTTERPRNCPTCESPAPERHPAVQFEGEVHLCKNEWHNFGDGKKYADPAPTSPRQPVSAPNSLKEVCQNCGRSYGVWFAPNWAWNAIIPERVGMLCPNCFIARADASEYECTGWELRPENAEAASLPVQQAKPPTHCKYYEALYFMVNQFACTSPAGKSGSPDEKLNDCSLSALEDAFRVLGIKNGITRAEFWKHDPTASSHNTTEGK